MKRTTVSLPDDLALALNREAERQHTSASEITRAALTAHLGLKADRPRELRFARVGRSGHRTTARNIEKLLQREWNDLPRDR
jgi:metal-responsive CopG/Arc/MetJ family transcriptional regulator